MGMERGRKRRRRREKRSRRRWHLARQVVWHFGGGVIGIAAYFVMGYAAVMIRISCRQWHHLEPTLFL